MFNQCLDALFHYKQRKKVDEEHEINMRINSSWKRLLMAVGLLFSSPLAGQTGTDLSKEWNCMGSMGWVFRAGSG